MKKNDTYTSVENVLRQRRNDEIKYWLLQLLYAVLFGVVVTAYWWVWIVMGLFIQFFS